MELGNYKIKVTTEAESREAQELFFALGYDWYLREKQYISIGNNTFITAYPDEMILRMGSGGDTKKETTLAQLSDLVVLHRNDVSDANCQYCDRPVLKLETQDYKVWDSENNAWSEYIGSQTDLRRGIKPIQSEQGLISGADALRALADGEEVEYLYGNKWLSVIGEQVLITAITGSKFNFRLKPRTITLNIEIPAPFEPKDGELFWFVSPYTYSGYDSIKFTGDCTGFMLNGVWRTEEEIKQVVAALRGALKNG